jgi:gas vesicle protein
MANQRSKDVIIGAVAGTVLGAVTALLLAPKSGRELRKDISGGVQQVTEKTQNVAKQIGTQTSEWFGKAKEATSQVVEHVRGWKAGTDKDEEAAAAVAATEEAPENEEKTTAAIER